MRLAFPFFLIAAILAGTAAVITEEPSYISITAEPATIKKGETFFLTVRAVVHTPVNAVDIIVDYPENQMEVTSIDTGGSVITLWAEDPYDSNGKIYLRGGTFQKGFLGEHTIARIRGIATETGSARIVTDSVKLIAGDGLGTEISVSNDDNESARVYVLNENGKLEGSVTVQIITDIDGDGDVDLRDISAFMAAWFDKNTIFDFNGDGRMTFRDFSIILAESFFK